MIWQLHNWQAMEWLMASRGHTVFDMILTALTIGGVLLFGALLRSGQGLPEKPPARTIVSAARRIKFVGYLIIAMRYVFVMTTSGDILITVVAELGLCAIIGGDIFVSSLALLGHPPLNHRTPAA